MFWCWALTHCSLALLPRWSWSEAFPLSLEAPREGATAHLFPCSLLFPPHHNYGYKQAGKTRQPGWGILMGGGCSAGRACNSDERDSRMGHGL